MFRVTLSILVSALAVLLALPAAARAGCFTTDFESGDVLDDPIVLGPPNAQAVLTDGDQLRVGILRMYRTGLRAWWIFPGDTGRIEFDPPLERVVFYTNDENANVRSATTVLDAEGALLGEFDGMAVNQDPLWLQVDIAVPAGQPGIATIVHANPAEPGANRTVIDDLSFCPGCRYVVERALGGAGRSMGDAVACLADVATLDPTPGP